MKKGIIVLLIAVLVAGFAFADGKAGEAKFTGSATISYDYDLDSKNTGINNASAMKYNFTFEFNSAAGESKGEGKLYAEIAAEAKLELVAKNAKATGELTPKATLKIKKANIVAGDITIDILGPKGFYSFASFYAANADGDPAEDVANEDTLTVLGLNKHGLRVLYKDFEVSFAFYHTEVAAVDAKAPTKATSAPYFMTAAAYAKKAEGVNVQTIAVVPGGRIVVDLNGKVASGASDSTKLYTGLQTPAFKLADGLTLTAGANLFLYFDSYTTVGGGFAVDYAPEDSKISASFGFDTEALIVKDADDVVLPIEISASAGYDFIKAYAYFATLNKFDSTFDFLAAKVEADYAVNDQLSVGGYAEILWLEIIGEGSPEFRFGANVAYTADKFGLEAGVDAWLQKVGDEYKLAGNTYFDGEDYPGLGLWVDVYSKAIIDNATVGIKWTGSDFTVKDADDKLAQLGSISAYATVAF